MGEDLFKSMDDILMNPLNEKEMISDTFKNIPQFKSDINVLSQRNFVEVFGKEEIR